MHRAPYLLLIKCAGALPPGAVHPGAMRTLAFGLRWQVLIGSNAAGLAQKRGRRLKATHYVMGGSLAMVAGYGRVRSGWRHRPLGGAGAHIQAAAQLYAVLYPSGGRSLIRLPDGRYWWVGAIDGTVLSQTDKVFTSQDEALRAQALLGAQRPELQEHDANETWAALLQAVDPDARLVGLPSRWAALPLAPRMFLACLGLSAVAPPLWNGLAPLVRSSPPVAVLPSSGDVSRANPYQVMLRDTVVHSPAELPRLLRSLGKLPIQVQGWALRRAQCDADRSGWNCSAAYARAHSMATNHQLYLRLPAGWQVSFNPLDEASLSWRVASDGVPLADLNLPGRLRVDTELVAGLQQLRPAFASLALAPAVPLSATGASLSGVTDSAQPEPRIVRRRALRVHGPLRSLMLLPGPILAARWSRLVLDVQAQLRPGLIASVLVAELDGDLYEQD
ncbi:hypothetical protein RAS12_12440 [Achromobacter seleniivolatilans]|uniref:Uncharacterized protein n=1 Tax=Achromobacter seleniivolatilans TaxID=3047478 RepID=A0ABY9MBH5_9BURK|nr:hypothetical protein [Achromobacter sp. R39]WMD23147.1 hypothetical protein RAS12_12440 [Achromobacter sp. R39]